MRAQMDAEIREYVALTAREHNLFIRCANAIAGKDLPEPAAVMLLATARVMGDLRVCEWAASHGYAIQSQAIAATVHEVAYSVAYIGNSTERAEEWLRHENERRQYPKSGHLSVLQAVLPSIGLTEAHIDLEYQVYRYLCLAKHGNPVLQRAHGVSTEESSRYIEQLPYYSKATVELARFGLFHAARAVSALPTVLLTTHFLDILDAPTLVEYSAILETLKELGIRDGLYEAGADGKPVLIDS